MAYLKNVYSGVKNYVIPGLAKDLFPIAKDFSDLNSEYMRSVKASAKDFIKAPGKTIASIDEIKTLAQGVKNAKTALKTGKIHSGDNSFGGFGDMGDMGGDWDSNFDNWDIEDTGKGSKSLNVKSNKNFITNVTANSFSSSNNTDAFSGLANVTAASGRSQLKASGRVYSGITQLVSFNANQTHAFYEASTKYYSDSTNVMNTISTQIGKLVTLTETLVAKSGADLAGSTISTGATAFDKVFGTNGAIDLKAYADQVSKNFWNQTPVQRDQIKMMLQDAITNPLAGVFKEGIASLMPDSFKKSLMGLNETLTNLPKLFMLKMADWSEDYNSSPFKRFIGKLFGISNSMGDIELGKYEKGAVAFDGVTRKTINTVIPSLLSKILSAINGRDELVFNHEKGQFSRKSAILDEHERSKKRAATQDYYDVKSSMMSGTSKMSYDEKKAMDAKLDYFFEELTKRGSLFSGQDKDFDNFDRAKIGSAERMFIQKWFKDMQSMSPEMLTTLNKAIVTSRGNVRSYNERALKEENGLTTALADRHLPKELRYQQRRRGSNSSSNFVNDVEQDTIEKNRKLLHSNITSVTGQEMFSTDPKFKRQNIQFNNKENKTLLDRIENFYKAPFATIQRGMDSLNRGISYMLFGKHTDDPNDESSFFGWLHSSFNKNLVFPLKSFLIGGKGKNEDDESYKARVEGSGLWGLFKLKYENSILNPLKNIFFGKIDPKTLERDGGLIGKFTWGFTTKVLDPLKGLLMGDKKGKGETAEEYNERMGGVGLLRAMVFRYETSILNPLKKLLLGKMSSRINLKQISFFDTIKLSFDTNILNPLRWKMLGKLKPNDVSSTEWQRQLKNFGLFDTFRYKFDEVILTRLKDMLLGTPNIAGEPAVDRIARLKNTGLWKAFTYRFELSVLGPLKTMMLGAKRPQGMSNEDWVNVTKNWGLWQAFTARFDSKILPQLKGMLLGIGRKPQGMSMADWYAQTKQFGIWSAFTRRIDLSIITPLKGLLIGMKKGIGETADDYRVRLSGAGIFSALMYRVNKSLLQPLNTLFFGGVSQRDKKYTFFSNMKNSFLGMFDSLKLNINQFLWGTKDIQGNTIKKGVLIKVWDGIKSSVGTAKDFFFGKVDKNGKVIKEGVFTKLMTFVNSEIFRPLKDVIRKDFARLKTFINKEVISPLQGVLSPYIKEIKLQFGFMADFAKSLLKNIGGYVNNMFKETFGKSLTGMIKDYVLQPMKTLLSSFKESMYKVLGSIIKAPIKLLRHGADRLNERHARMGEKANGGFWGKVWDDYKGFRDARDARNGTKNPLGDFELPSPTATSLGSVSIPSVDNPLKGMNIMAKAQEKGNQFLGDIAKNIRRMVGVGKKIKGIDLPSMPGFSGIHLPQLPESGGYSAKDHAKDSVSMPRNISSISENTSKTSNYLKDFLNKFKGFSFGSGSSSSSDDLSSASPNNASSGASSKGNTSGRTVIDFLMRIDENTFKMASLLEGFGGYGGGSGGSGSKGKGFFGKLWNVVTSPFRIVGKVFGDIYSAGKKLTEGLAWVGKEVIKEMISIPFTIGRELIKVTGSLVRGLVDVGAGIVRVVGGMMTATICVLGRLAQGMATLVGKTIEGVATIGAALIDSFASIATGVVDITVKLGSAVGQTLIGLGQFGIQLGLAAGKLTMMAVETIPTLAKGIYDFGATVLKTFWNGFKEVGGFLAGVVASPLKTALGINTLGGVRKVEIVGGYLDLIKDVSVINHVQSVGGSEMPMAAGAESVVIPHNVSSTTKEAYRHANKKNKRKRTRSKATGNLLQLPVKEETQLSTTPISSKNETVLENMANSLKSIEAVNKKQLKVEEHANGVTSGEGANTGVANTIKGQFALAKEKVKAKVEASRWKRLLGSTEGTHEEIKSTKKSFKSFFDNFLLIGAALMKLFGDFKLGKTLLGGAKNIMEGLGTGRLLGGAGKGVRGALRGAAGLLLGKKAKDALFGSRDKIRDPGKIVFSTNKKDRAKITRYNDDGTVTKGWRRKRFRTDEDILALKERRADALSSRKWRARRESILNPTLGEGLTNARTRMGNFAGRMSQRMGNGVMARMAKGGLYNLGMMGRMPLQMAGEGLAALGGTALMQKTGITGAAKGLGAGINGLSLGKIAEKTGLGSIAGKIGARVASKGLIGGLLGPIGMGLMAGADAVGGWNKAGQIFGHKEGEEATLGEKVSSGAAGAISGLTFGLIPQEWLAKTINEVGGKVVGALSEAWDGFIYRFMENDTFQVFIGTTLRIKDTIGEVYDTIADWCGDAWSSATETFDDISSGVGNVTSSIVSVSKSIWETLTQIGDFVLNLQDSVVKTLGAVGKSIAESVFWLIRKIPGVGNLVTDDVVKSVTGAIDNTASAFSVKDNITRVKNFASDLYDGAVGFVNNQKDKSRARARKYKGDIEARNHIKNVQAPSNHASGSRGNYGSGSSYQSMGATGGGGYGGGYVSANNGSGRGVNNLGAGIGAVSVKYESSGDPGNVVPDTGNSMSYGLFQFNSKQGSADGFVNWMGTQGGPGPAFASRLNMAGGAGSDTFNETWKQIANEAPNEFAQLQMGFAAENFYAPTVEKIRSKNGYDISTKSRGVQEAAMSMGIQHGTGGAQELFDEGITQRGMNPNQMSDKEVLEAWYGRRIEYLNSAGHSSIAQNRMPNELNDVLSLADGSGGSGYRAPFSMPQGNNNSNDNSSYSSPQMYQAPQQNYGGSSSAIPSPSTYQNTFGGNNSNAYQGSGERAQFDSSAPLGFSTSSNPSNIDVNQYLTGKIQGVNPIFLQRVAMFAKDHGGTINISSGYRSIEEQAQLWEESDKSGTMVAAPGRSRHNYAMALDGDFENFSDAELNKYGLYKPMDYEQWHIEPVETKGVASADLPKISLNGVPASQFMGRAGAGGGQGQAPVSFKQFLQNAQKDAGKFTITKEGMAFLSGVTDFSKGGSNSKSYQGMSALKNNTASSGSAIGTAWSTSTPSTATSSVSPNSPRYYPDQLKNISNSNADLSKSSEAKLNPDGTPIASTKAEVTSSGTQLAVQNTTQQITETKARMLANGNLDYSPYFEAMIKHLSDISSSNNSLANREPIQPAEQQSLKDDKVTTNDKGQIILVNQNGVKEEVTKAQAGNLYNFYNSLQNQNVTQALKADQDKRGKIDFKTVNKIASGMN